MRISDPILAPDVSIWCDHINSKEFEDGGCGSVVVGLYVGYDNTGGKVLSPVSRQQCIDVATRSSMALQGYFWDDITQDPIEQADWVANILKTENLPIKWLWIDQEQWWSDWTAWQQARLGKIPMSQVPAATPAAISDHFNKFMLRLHGQVAQSGVYTNNGFVSTWAPGMNAWLPQYQAWVPQYGRQPKTQTQMTWDQLKSNWMPDYEIILASGQNPTLVMGHQFTGDACILPGSYGKLNNMLPLDISVFSKSFINELKGISPPPSPLPPPSPTDYVVLYARVNVRALPDANSTWIRYAVKDEILHVVTIENDWAKLTDGTYVYSGYITYAPKPTPTPPPPASTDYVVLYSRINVRARPDSNSTWVRFAFKDEVLHVVKIENDWAQLTDGTYVYAAYIKYA